MINVTCVTYIFGYVTRLAKSHKNHYLCENFIDMNKEELKIVFLERLNLRSSPQAPSRGVDTTLQA